MTAEATLVITSRVEAARRVLAEEGVDTLLVAPSADMQYLAGYGGHPSERPTLVAIQRSGPVVMLVPALEAPRVPLLPDMTMAVWGETDDPYEVLATALGGGRRFAISDQAWAAVILRLQAAFPSAGFEPASPLLRRLRMIKSADELELLTVAGAKADDAFGEFVTMQFSGKSESVLGQTLDELLRQRGLTNAWGPIVAGGPNSASPHHMTGERVIREGDAVLLDFGGTINGYGADMTRTVHVGTPGDEFETVYETVRRAQQAAVEAVRPGIAAQDVDGAARDVIERAGFGREFVHRTGHGIGLDTHEEPYIVRGNRLPLEPGMTFSVEPGVYIEGKFGVRIEDIVAVTGDGARRLNGATRELVVVR